MNLEAVNIEAVRNADMVAVRAIIFFQILRDEVFPLIDELVKVITSIINQLSATEEEKVGTLLHKLTTCKELTTNLLNLANKYVSDVKKCLRYASLNTKQALWIKQVYKRFTSQQSDDDFDENYATSFQIAQLGGVLTVAGVVLNVLLTGALPIGFAITGTVGLTLVATPAMVKYCRRTKQRDFKSLQSYLKNLSKYCDVAARTFCLFKEDCRQVKDECNEALTLCQQLVKHVGDKKNAAKCTGAVGVVGGMAVFIGAAVALGVVPLGAAASVVAAVGVGGGGTAVGSGAATYSFVKHCNEITEKLETIKRKFTTLDEKVHDCSGSMNLIVQKIKSVKDDKTNVEEHVTTQDDYYSFCKVLDLMLDSVADAQTAIAGLRNNN